MTSETDTKVWDTLEWLIDDEINKVYQARQAKRKRRDWFSASSAGYCPRATILKRMAAKEDDHDAKTKRMFWLGDCIHKAIQDLVKQSGRAIALEEFAAPYGSGDISGAFDIILKDLDAYTVLHELKSTGDGMFWKRVLKDKEPAIQHVYQAVTYWILNKKYRIDKIKITYVSREGVFVRSFNVKVTPELVQQVRDWWDMVRSFQKKRELPPIYEADTEEYKKWCKPGEKNGCTFARHFCFGDHNDIADNLLQLDWGPAEDGTKKERRKEVVLVQERLEEAVEEKEPTQVQTRKPTRKSAKNKAPNSNEG